MATPRRRSARLSKAAQTQRTPGRKTPLSALQLGSLLERDETPNVADQQQSIDNVVETPASAATIQEHLSKLSSLRTPRTEPRPERGEMHPKAVHQTTTKAPDSGLKLGFVDIPPHPRTTVASVQNTPSKSRDPLPAHLNSPVFEFKFGTETQLSSEAQKLMENVREEAARIKAQMQAEKSAQDQKDGAAEQMFNGVNGSGRKIAKPKGKSGRFSDVHMAQFKKMDSIANHASAFRGRPGFAQPTAQSLKRSGSKAGLDDLERPRTAGKGTPGRQPPPFLGRPSSVSPFKSIPPTSSDDVENTTPAKRQRRSVAEDVSSARHDQLQPTRPSGIPTSVSSNLLSPTKASLARSRPVAHSSPGKASMLPRSTTLQSVHPTSRNLLQRSIATDDASTAVPTFAQKQTTGPSKPLPALPRDGDLNQGLSPIALKRSQSTVSLATTGKPSGFGSRLPTFAGLKSILRPNRKPLAVPTTIDRPGTPKRPNTASGVGESGKKVDFTPSVKSRYAVKLAAGSPSPAKLPHVTPAKVQNGPIIPYDPAAYMIGDDDNDEEDEDWEDAESEIEYPTLPDLAPGPVVNTFSQKAKDHNRRESKEFKSIFTTLHHPSRPSPSTHLTSVNTAVNQTNPAIHADRVLKSPKNPNMSKPSPSTIRRVRSSGVTDLVQPFEDANVKTVPHGVPGKKRRRDSIIDNDQHGMDDDAKENRRISVMPPVPGGWEESILAEDEGEKRGGKRMRVGPREESAMKKPEVKKPNAAREAAAKNAKERKGKGILSLSRLNMLSRPKHRS